MSAAHDRDAHPELETRDAAASAGDSSRGADGGGPLRQMAIRSGAYLAGREAVGAAVRLAGLVLVTRRIGPSDYGIYTAASTYVLFAVLLAQMGSEVFLVRLPGPLSRRRCDEAFTFLLVTSILVTGAGLALSFAVAPWIRPTGVLGPMRVLLLSVPVNVLWAPAQAAIERQFAYRKMGLLELGGDAILYGTAVPLALRGAGVWSLVAGYIAWQTWLLVGAVVLSGLRPRLAWSRETSKALLRHGVGYSLTPWLLSARSALVTLVVGAFTGAKGVGYMGFATRLVSTINFTERGMQRVGMVAISRARDSGSSRLPEALEEGLLLQTLAAAVPFAAFGVAARWVVPDVFGHDWLPALPVYVLLALAAVLKMPASAQRILLFAHGRNLDVAVSAVIELLLVVGVSIVAVRTLGVAGFGIATVVGAGATLYTHHAARRFVTLRYRRLAVPVVALVPPVLMPFVPMPWTCLMLAPVALLFANRATREELSDLAATIRSAVGTRGDRSRRRTWQGAGRTWPAMWPLLDRVGWTSRVAPQPALVMAYPTGFFASGGDDVGTNGCSSHRPPDPRSLRPFVPTFAPAVAADERAPWVSSGGPAGAGTVPFRPAPVPFLGPPEDPDLESLRGPGGAGGVDPLVDRDPVTGLPSASVLLAKTGRLLGAARGSGWSLLVACFDVGGGKHARSEPELLAVADALRSVLRFDDPVARLGPTTFVVAVPFVGPVAEGADIAAHLGATIASAVAAWREGDDREPGVRGAQISTPLPSIQEADRLVREVVDGVRG